MLTSVYGSCIINSFEYSDKSCRIQTAHYGNSNQTVTYWLTMSPKWEWQASHHSNWPFFWHHELKSLLFKLFTFFLNQATGWFSIVLSPFYSFYGIYYLVLLITEYDVSVQFLHFLTLAWSEGNCCCLWSFLRGHLWRFEDSILCISDAQTTCMLIHLLPTLFALAISLQLNVNIVIWFCVSDIRGSEKIKCLSFRC